MHTLKESEKHTHTNIKTSRSNTNELA